MSKSTRWKHHNPAISLLSVLYLPSAPVTHAALHPFKRIKCDDAATCLELQYRQVAVFICTLYVLLWSLRLISAFCKNTTKEILLSSICIWGKSGWRFFKSLQRSACYMSIITSSLTSIICLFKCLSSSISGYTLPCPSESLDCLCDLWGDSGPAVLRSRMLLSSQGKDQSPWTAECCLLCSDNERHTIVKEPDAEQAVYLVLVFMSLIIHEIIHHGNNENLLGCKHS